MSTIVTRSGKGAALTHTEVDANFTNLNADKAEASAVILATEKGAASGVCPLDAASKVASTYLPSYVDDVLEYANYAGLPVTGETGKIYVALDTNKTYRWSGSAYIYITSGAVDSVAGRTGVVTLTSADVGLGNVTNNAAVANLSGTNTGDQTLPTTLPASDVYAWAKEATKPTYTATEVSLGNASNTSDANKPISTATQTALDLKSPLASPTFTGTVSGITKAMVSLGNVDNTTDANKPVSTATQTALDLKAPLASPTFTGTVSGITATMVGLGNVTNNTAVANLSGTNTGDQILPTTLPASDVYAWAKEATKPTYTYTEVGAQVAGTYATGTGSASGVNTGDQTSVTGNAGSATSISGGSIGALPYQSDVNTTAMLAVGTTGQVLTSNGAAAPTWATPAAGGVTSVNTRTGAVTLTSSDVGLGNVTNTAQVTSVTGTAPVVSSGGTTPAISIAAATASVNGYMTSTYATKLDAITGTNTGNETNTTIKTALGITTLSGSNTGDETLATIKTKLGITTLSGSNTGDQTNISGNATGLSVTLAVASGGTGLTAVGTSGNVLTSNGTAWVSSAPSGGGSLLRQTVFTASGTWTKGAGTTKILAQGVGGGGGGGWGGGGYYGTGGGGAGGYADKFIDVAAISTITVTIGSGGAANSTGGTTSFGAHFTCTGGTTGNIYSGTGNYGGDGGSATGGGVNINGGGGGAGEYNKFGGIGGASYFGGGGRSPGAGDYPQAGQAYGSGGSGIASTAASWGTGFGGIIIVSEFA